MDRISVTDLYQASFLIVNGCELESVECVPINETLSCKLSFTGENLLDLQNQYFQHGAVVNLYAFRQAYQQVNSYIHQAKKTYNMTRKRQEAVGGVQ